MDKSRDSEKLDGVGKGAGAQEIQNPVVGQVPSVEKDPWASIARSELFDGWQRWTSFACIWMWSCTAGLLSFKSDVAGMLSGIFAVPNSLLLFSTSVALLIALILSGKIKTIIGSRRTMIVAGSALTLGTGVVVLAVFLKSVPMFVGGMILGGIALAPLKIAWGEMFSKMDLQRSLVSMGYAVLASMIVILIVYDAPQKVLAGIFFIASIPCAHLAFEGTKKIDASMSKKKSSSGSIVFSSSLLLLPAMVAFSYGVVKSTIPFLAPEVSISVMVSTQFAELMVGISLVVFAVFSRKYFGPAQVYSVALIAVVAGLILMASRVVTPWATFFLSDFGFILFYFFMVVYWGDLSWRTGMPIVRIYTIGYFTFQCLNTVGLVLGYYVTGFHEQTTFVFIILAIVLCLFVVALLLFGASQSQARQWLIADGSSIEQTDDIPQACVNISQAYGLSPREQEVLGLLARGRNASFMARALFISPDTAKTHIKNIYRKLGVHTQQEVLDLVEETVSAR